MYLKELEQAPTTNFSHTLCQNPSEDTIIYLHIGGRNPDELEQALNCIYLDHTRDFKLVDIKRQPHLISALIVMEKVGKRDPVKF